MGPPPPPPPIRYGWLKSNNKADTTWRTDYIWEHITGCVYDVRQNLPLQLSMPKCVPQQTAAELWMSNHSRNAWPCVLISYGIKKTWAKRGVGQKLYAFCQGILRLTPWYHVVANFFIETISKHTLSCYLFNWLIY